MACRCKKHEPNGGFSLIELLIAIAILSMLTVPLMNSFIMSGKINRNSRRLQNATAVAQSVAEVAKHTTDREALEAALKSIPGVYDFPADSKANEENPVYTFKIDGADGEKFRVNVSLTPKTDYDYKDTEFADLYNDASVIYSELILYDNKVLSLMKSQKIPYTSTDVLAPAPKVEKWNSVTGSWVASVASADDMAIRDTYGNLFADEYAGSEQDGISKSDLTDIYSKFKKSNIDKIVDINIAQAGDKYNVTINTTYSFAYSVVYRADDLTGGTNNPVGGTDVSDESDVTNASTAASGENDVTNVSTAVPKASAGTNTSTTASDGDDDTDESTASSETSQTKKPTAFYRCSGTLVYKADEISLVVDNEKPLYFLYAKAEGEKLAEDGATVGETADARHFNSVSYNVSVDSGVNLVNTDGTSRNMKLYFVEQAGTVQEDSFSINLENNSLATELDVYTTELYNTLDATFFVNNVGSGVNVYSTKDLDNSDNHIAYNKGDNITSLYKVIVSVDYDADRDGNYSEQVYSVSTDD